MATSTNFLQYPGDLKTNNSDFVQFNFYNYKPPYEGGGSNATDYVEQYNKSLQTSNLTEAPGYKPIVLYMPEDISTSYQGTWGGREFGPLAPIALAGAGQIMSMGRDQIKSQGGNIANQIGGIGIQGMLPYVGSSLIARAMNSIPGFGGGVTTNDILASTKGQILNPNTEVLYQGPQLRTFSLTFKMVPRTKDEAKGIKDICTQFKKAALPSGATGTEKNLIGVPKILSVVFKQAADKNSAAVNNPWVSQYKTCALGGVDINYTPDGSWATYRDGSPVATQLTLQFQELKLVYESDVDDGY